jgi:hypothetical protein
MAYVIRLDTPLKHAEQGMSAIADFHGAPL